MTSLRPTAHTGENRCWPCTVANLVIAAGAAAALALRSAMLAAAAFATGAAIVWYVGYLVPGTPYLTRRLLPDRVVRRFGKAPDAPAVARPDGGSADVDDAGIDDPDAAPDADGGSETAGDAAVDRLLKLGVLEAHDDGSLELSPSFDEAWRERINALRGDERAQRDSFASMLGVDPATVTFDPIDSTGALSVRVEDGSVSQWISRAALVADVAASDALVQRDPEWDELPFERRHAVLVGLRQFRDRCPACGGGIDSRTEVNASCCWTNSSITARCEDCESRLYVIAEHPE